MATTAVYPSKFCKSCERTLPLTEFNNESRRKDGKAFYCRECSNQRSRDWASRNGSRERINENWNRSYDKARGLIVLIKERGSCAICGESESICLDFHHVDPSTKKQQVARCNSVRGIIEESTKCTLLCRNCHAKGHGGIIDISHLVPMTLEYINDIVTDYARSQLLREAV